MFGNLDMKTRAGLAGAASSAMLTQRKVSSGILARFPAEEESTHEKTPATRLTRQFHVFVPSTGAVLLELGVGEDEVMNCRANNPATLKVTLACAAHVCTQTVCMLHACARER